MLINYILKYCSRMPEYRGLIVVNISRSHNRSNWNKAKSVPCDGDMVLGLKGLLILVGRVASRETIPMCTCPEA